MKKYLYFIGILAGITIICGLAYGIVQQSYRAAADDPQVQLSEDIAHQLADTDSTPQQTIPTNHIDIGKSLSAFVIVYDEDGLPLAGSGTLEGKFPSPPAGVFSFARDNGQHRLTWQPAPEVRIAMVMNYYRSPSHSGYVLAGRSLRETEARVSHLTTIVLIAWLALICIAGILWFLRTPQI